MMLIYMLMMISVIGISSGDELIELNHDLDPDQSTKFQYKPPFTHEEVSVGMAAGGYWFASYKFCSHEHFGTHMDAPFHFNEKGWKVDEIPLDRLIAPVVVIDIRDKVKKNNIYELSAADVMKWLDQHGPFPNNSVVLVNTGWDQRYHISKKAYYGHETNSALYVFPGVGLSAAQTFIGLKASSGIHIVGVGIDSKSIDSSRAKDYASHQEFAAANIYLLENLKDVHKVPTTGAELIVMPVKIKGGSGAPSRVVSRIPQNNGVVLIKSSLAMLATCLYFVLNLTNI